jgi:hypothetical protein
VPAFLCLGLWLYVALVFVAVEGIEALRLWLRVREYGWRAGVGVYDVSQWARNFTFGMFYAFTAAALERFAPGADPAWLVGMQRAVAAVGPWVVLALLLIEGALAAFARRAPEEA